MASSVLKESSSEPQSTMYTENNTIASDSQHNSECMPVIPLVDIKTCNDKIEEEGKDEDEEDEAEGKAEPPTNAGFSAASGQYTLSKLAPLEDVVVANKRKRSSSSSAVDNRTTTKKVLGIWRRRASSFIS